MEILNRKSVNDNLSKYDYLAKENSFIEVTEWTNGEGFNITIDDRCYNFTEGEIDAINYLIKTLQYAKH